METAMIKERLHEYIDHGDDKFLKMMFAMAKEYNDDNDLDDDYEFTAEDIKEFESRRQDRINGETTIYTWEQAKEIITGKKAS